MTASGRSSATAPSTSRPSVMSSSAWLSPIDACARGRATRSTASRPSIPPAPATRTLDRAIGCASRQGDLRVVADDHPQRLRHLVARASVTLRPSRLASMRTSRSRRLDAGEQDRVLDLGADDLAARASIEVYGPT